MPALLSAAGLDVAIDGRTLVRRLTLNLTPGAMVAVLGPNGVGKTLTLHALAGLRAPAAGAVRARGTDLRLLGERERALRAGLLLQDHEDPFPTTVIETALMGRNARLGLWQWESSTDHSLAHRALAEMDLAGMDARLSATLSGGERRRLGLAMLLVQDPDVMLLDEPLNHLDPRHQFAVLASLRRLAMTGKAVVASLHDPVLAARHFDTVLLLHGDGRWQLGPAGQLLDAATLAGLYAVPFERYRREGGEPAAVVLPAPPPADAGPGAANVTPLRRRPRG